MSLFLVCGGCSLLFFIGFHLIFVAFGQNGFFSEMTQGQLIEMYIVFACLMVMAYWK